VAFSALIAPLHGTATRRLAAVLAQSADLVTAKLDPLSRNTASARLHVTDCAGPSARRPRAG